MVLDQISLDLMAMDQLLLDQIAPGQMACDRMARRQRCALDRNGNRGTDLEILIIISFSIKLIFCR